MLSEIAAAWAVRLGYTNVIRHPAGYQGWTGQGLGVQNTPTDKK